MEDKKAILRETDAILRKLRENRGDQQPQVSPFIGDTSTLDIRVSEKPTTDEFVQQFNPKSGQRQVAPPERPK